MSRTLRRLGWAAQPAVIGVVLWLALGGSRRDFRVPLVFRNDALFYLAQAKATIDVGWWWTNPSIGAPSEHHALLFPQTGNIDQAVVRVVGLFWHDVAPAVTASWFVMVLLSGASAAWCLRRLGVSAVGAWAASVLFAVSPFTLYRNTAHFNLTPYLIPFAATAALRLAAAPEIDCRWRGTRALIAGNLLLGFNTIYYACFGAFFVALGAVAGALRSRRASRLAAGGTMLGAIVLATIVNLTPTLIAWQREGQPEGVRHRVADSELYGLKIRHLVSPLPDHWFPPFRTWDVRDVRAAFPNETENAGSRLGLVATAGFLGLMVVLMVPSLAGGNAGSETIRDASRLTLAAILLATVGGLGSVFSVLVSPDIRSYTRITPFIAFFSLAAVALWIDGATTRRSRRRGVIWAGILAIGLLDQTLGVRPLNASAPAVAAEFRRLRFFVGLLEQRLPSNAMVLQLPVRPYPLDGGVSRMGTYDHFKLYLVSHSLRWSYPALSLAQVRQEKDMASVDPHDLPAYSARQGFAAIVVDRLGYEDNGAAIVAALQIVPEQAVVIGQTDRYVALDLRFAAATTGDAHQ